MVMAAAIGTGLSIAATLLGLSAMRWWKNSKPCHDPSKSAVLITGGSRGIGRAAADHLLSKGYSVLVTIRKKSQYDEMIHEHEAESKNSSGDNNDNHGNKKLYPIFLDVAEEEHVPNAINQLKSFLDKHDKQLIALVNNAGINPEGIKIQEIFDNGEELKNVLAESHLGSQIFETNVIGVGRVTKACLPLLAKDGGRVINIGSYFGSISGKLKLDHCYYEASKFALEGMTNNMRISLKNEGIKVVLIKPGNIQTNMNKSAGEVSTDVVSKDIELAIASPNPNARYYPGTVKGMSTKLVCLVFELLPTWLSDKL